MKNNSGFTLIELSVVLIILGFLTTTSITMTRGYINYQKHKQTKERIEKSAYAINEYVLKNKRLPCPTDMKKNYKENKAVENCSTKEVDGVLIGAIPADTLKINDNDLADAWNDKLIYMVSKNYTDNFMKNYEDTTLVDNKFAYVIVSSGPDRNYAYPYQSSSVTKNSNTSANDYKNSYDGFNNNLEYDDIDDIIYTYTAGSILQSLGLYNLDCYIDYGNLEDEINNNCSGYDYFDSFSGRYISYGEKYISPSEDYIEKTIYQPDGSSKTIYTHLKKCIIECSKYGRPVVYLQISDI